LAITKSRQFLSATGDSLHSNLLKIVIALLVTAGIAAASRAEAQDDASYYEAMDLLPLWRIRGEYLHWWSNGNPLPPLVTCSPPGTPRADAGVLGTPGVEILLGNETIDTGSRSGGRVTISRWLEDAEETVVEFVGFYTPISAAPLQLTFLSDAASSVVELKAVSFEPGDRASRFVESRFAENGVMAAAVEQDPQDAMRHDLDLAAGLDELAGQLFGLGVLETFEPAINRAILTESPSAVLSSHGLFLTLNRAQRTPNWWRFRT
jgi:Putative beta barrel porin-7 (BBP7)